MDNSKNVLVVRIASLENVDYISLRNDILESVRLGVLILGVDETLEVMELPPLGAIEVIPAETHVLPDPETPTEAEEKRQILQRLKDYRAASGLGALEAVSVKTAHQKEKRLSADTLRYLCADGAPKLPMTAWRKISRALDLLEQKEQKGD